MSFRRFPCLTHEWARQRRRIVKEWARQERRIGNIGLKTELLEANMRMGMSFSEQSSPVRPVPLNASSQEEREPSSPHLHPPTQGPSRFWVRCMRKVHDSRLEDEVELSD
ncbi:hypothetical protein CDAR_317851 [Caerostris darwini]|uniref:Uncharacterized protein n=1 Tax=Caerostris darwini TaxID=1538125 RepID=A0AAV4WST1_9ARAC|nr:hypothetical protein CDAR_317851 [Caerostris darwini]